MSSSNGDQVPKWGWGTLRVQSDQLPLLIAVFSGGALLILLILAVVLWRCCVAPHRNKDYRVKMSDSSTVPPRTVVPVLPSQSAVYLDPKSGQWSVSSRVIGCWRGGGGGGGGGHWFYNNSILNPRALDKCLVPRSISVPTPHHHPHASVSTLPSPMTRPIRPHSQCSPLRPGGPASLPQMSEFYPNANFCASTSMLNESLSELYCCTQDGEGISKTQSLPACVRSKSRPLSAGEDPAQLYSKVNFSKKRKNRMRNDEAAIIALSKSGSQFLDKDTDTLVDNEAVVVYDERTAL